MTVFRLTSVWSLTLRPANTRTSLAFPHLVLKLVIPLLVGTFWFSESVLAVELRAGTAKVDITDDSAGPANDRMYARALVITDGSTTTAIVAVDAVAIGGIGFLNDSYLGNVRTQVEKELHIKPEHVAINASHCHGIVRRDSDQLTVQAIRQASQNLVPVRTGSGVGQENRIMENRRFKLKNGREADMRHAYSLPSDEEIAAIGPVDPEIGILRLDKSNGETLAVLYNFACHPILGVPSGTNTADLTGFSSKVIEENLSEGTIALFFQGCAGDINPVTYKEVAHPRDAETLGNLLGLSVLKAVHSIQTTPGGELKIINETLDLPRADLAERIAFSESEIVRLTKTLTGTSLNFKTFTELYVKYHLSPEYPSYYSHGYMHDKLIGRDDLAKMDALNRSNMQAYLKNIYTMEELTRLQTNLALLKMHQAQNVAAGKRTVTVEIFGLRVGNFVLLTFPGELTVQIGLNIKSRSPHEKTFVAGYTNGYIYYSPTAEQLLNVGNAQEDSDCILAPEWQALFEQRAGEILGKL